MTIREYVFWRVIDLLVSTWLAMILIGMAHGYDARIPALGWNVTLLLGVSLGLFTSNLTRRITE